MVEQRDPTDLGQHLPHNLKPLPRDFRCVEKDPGYVAAGSADALRYSGRNRIGFKIERDDWNGLRRVPRSHKTIRCDGKDDVYAGCELSSVFAKYLTVASSGSYNQNSFFTAEFAEQPFANQSFSVRAQRTRKEDTDLSRSHVLRTNNQWPARHRTTKKRDELAPFHCKPKALPAGTCVTHT